MQIRRIACPVLSMVCLVVCAGCLTPTQVDRHLQAGHKEMYEIPKAIYGAARSSPNADQLTLNAYEGAFEARVEKISAGLAELSQEIRKMEDGFKNGLLTIARVAAASAGITIPGGASMEEIFSSAFGKVKDDAKKAGEEGVAKVGEGLKALLAEYTETKKLLDDTRLELGLTTREQEWAKEELKKLTEELRGKLAAITAETQDKLKAAKDDRKEFERILMEEGKLTPEQIENLKGFTTEQIMALIAAATAAAGAGAVAGRSGRSRSQPEIDELYDKVGAISTTVAAVEGALAKPGTSNS